MLLLSGMPAPLPHADSAHFMATSSNSETIRVMGLAFEMALVALRLAVGGGLHAVLARKIMDIGKGQQAQSQPVCEGVSGEFRTRRRRQEQRTDNRRGRRSKSFRNGVAAVA